MNTTLIIGTGPVGRHCAETLRAFDPSAQITLIGNEPAYDRVRLVDLIDSTATPESLAASCPFEVIEGTVAAIDSENRTVRLANGRLLPFGSLVIATGATPIEIPDVPGKVFSLRSMTDSQAIAMVASEAKNAVVVGGGTLGVEVACALKVRHPRLPVSLVHSSSKLLDQMLCRDGADYIAEDMAKAGIALKLNARAKAFRWKDGVVTGIKLDNGETLPADLVIVAIGVRPNDRLAKQSGLATRHGVVIDGACRASHAHIYAIGDCTQGSEGLIEPGFRQAERAARAIAGINLVNTSAKSLLIKRLKTSHQAFSVGDIQSTHHVLFRRPDAFRKIFLDRHRRVVGAVMFGVWEKHAAIEHAIMRGESISASRLILFKYFGLSPFSSRHPKRWNDDAVICRCRQVTKGQIDSAHRHSLATVGTATAAGTGCGACKPLIARLVGEKPAPVRHANLLTLFAAMAAILTQLMAVFAVPYPDTFHNPLNALYRDYFVKQMTGYSVLALGLALSAIGLRRRLASRAYDGWKLAHAMIGVVVPCLLLIHSGWRFGDGLTFALSTAFVGAALTGGLLALFLAQGHNLQPDLSAPSQKILHWLHVLFLWPLPVLLAFHILQSYFWRQA